MRDSEKVFFEYQDGRPLFERRTSQIFFDKYEELSPYHRRELINSRLSEFIFYSKNKVSFYNERLNEFDINSENPLEKIPVLQAEDIRELVPPTSTALLSQSTDNYSVFQSGGTTGYPKTTLFSHFELEMLNIANARGFFAMGLKPEDRVGNLFAVGSLYMTFVHINRMLQQYGCMNFPFSNNTKADFVHMTAKLFEMNVLTGIASVILDTLRKCYEIGAQDLKVKKIYYGGEHFYETDARELKDKFGVELIGAPGYGTVDTWYIGYQCQSSPMGTFHAHDDQCYIEIVDEETGKPCKENEIGMLYATPMVRTLTPIVRYRVGDRASWIESCVCGRTTPRFKLYGRGDDILRIGYDSIDYNFVQEVVLGFGELSGSVQIVKERKNGKDLFIVNIESEVSDSERGNLEQEVANTITEKRPTLRDHVQKQIVHPVKVNIVKLGKLDRNPKTGKLRRVIDVH